MDIEGAVLLRSEPLSFGSAPDSRITPGIGKLVFDLEVEKANHTTVELNSAPIRRLQGDTFISLLHTIIAEKRKLKNGFTHTYPGTEQI